METDDNNSSISINSIKTEVKNAEIESEDISVSQLELMANKKKLNKKSSEISVSQLSDNESVPRKTRTRGKTTSEVTIQDSSSSFSHVKTKTRAKTAEYENRNDQIRREKSEFLYKLNKLNVKGKWSSLHLDMNNSLDEIKNEYERVKNEIQTERSVEFCKRMLLLGVQGIEMMNSKFDPVGVDLDGWSEAMGYSMENQEYDEVLAELYEKYKGRGTMSPEVKLIFMIISSATMFTVTKRLTMVDSNNMFKNFIGSMMNNQNQSQPPQFQAPPQFQQQQFNQQQFSQSAHEYQQPKTQQQFYKPQARQRSQNFGPMPHNANNMVNMDNHSESTVEDITPSKMKSPDVDTIDIDNILKTMNERKREKERIQEQELFEKSDTSDILKNIAFNGKKKGRGRPPRKAAAKLN